MQEFLLQGSCVLYIFLGGKSMGMHSWAFYSNFMQLQFHAISIFRNKTKQFRYMIWLWLQNWTTFWGKQTTFDHAFGGSPFLSTNPSLCTLGPMASCSLRRWVSEAEVHHSECGVKFWVLSSSSTVSASFDLGSVVVTGCCWRFVDDWRGSFLFRNQRILIASEGAAVSLFVRET